MRSTEYDTVSDRYDRFLRDELLLQATAQYNNIRMANPLKLKNYDFHWERACGNTMSKLSPVATAELQTCPN
jgi:hypothetical protein